MNRVVTMMLVMLTACACLNAAMAQDQPPAQQSGGPLIGHKVNKRVHRAECEWAQKVSEKNRQYFTTYKEAVEAGYSPCVVCKPDQVPSPVPSKPKPVRGAWVEPSAEPPFVGDVELKLVHRADCARAQEIPARKRIFFKTFAAASFSGYSPCKLCAPGEGEAAAPPPAEPAKKPITAGRPFIGHSGTKKVHTAECKHAEKISEKNRVYFETYAEAVNAGYVPCKVCRPDQKAGGEAAPPAAPAELPFVGHMGSKRVHLRNCKWVQMAPKDKIEYFKTYQDAIDAGYSPCKTCEPDKAPTGKGAPPVSLSPGTSEAPPGAPSAAAPAAPVYIGHTGTKKVHLASCSWAEKMSERNRTQFNSYQEAVAEGYIPCKVCKPDMAAGGAAMTAEARASPEAPFVGHRGTRKVHTAECRYARAVSERNRITFATFQEAAAAGYVSCKVCKPDLVAGAAAPKAPAPQPTATATAEAAAPSPNGYVSSEAAKTFHRPDCEWAKKISPEKTVKYATKEEALAAGKSPCQVCKP